jgi:catechol 2,3-dioxygenase-like lactoylglutathione lyase family enzyme
MHVSSTAIFDHVGLTVGDLEAAIDWYSRALDLCEEFRFDLPAYEFRGAMMIGPTRYRIELIERAGSKPGPRPANPVDAALTRGYGHICLDVEDVDVAYRELLAVGASDRMSPRASPEPGIRMAFVADPEGNLIELLDRAAVRTRGASFAAEVHVPVGEV